MISCWSNVYPFWFGLLLFSEVPAFQLMPLSFYFKLYELQRLIKTTMVCLHREDINGDGYEHLAAGV
jgi:hypothetical protein